MVFNKNKKMNKKGADKVLSLYWFAIILIVSVGIFSMVYIFYSAPYDVRDMESKILSEKVADCFSQRGMINSNLIAKEGFNKDFDILRECYLNFETEDEYDWKSQEQFFVEAEFYSVDDLKNPEFILSEGNLNWKPSCFIKDKSQKSYDRLVKCDEEKIYVSGGDSEQYLIKILSGVGKIEKNVKQ